MNTATIEATVDESRKVTSGARFVPAAPEAIFELLANPTKHAIIDGSGTVRNARVSGPDRLSLGAKFGMNMNIGPIPYFIANTVSEFTEFSVIEWHHFGRHRWRYELQPVEGGTMVTETFAWGPAIMPAIFYQLAGYPERHRSSIDQTLRRLAEHFGA